jgi:hypothetical protein
MIKSINSTSPSITAYVSSPATPYINNSGGQGVGNVRFNTTNQCMEVYDGYSWIQLTSSVASVGLTPEVELLIDWARLKKHEEENINTLARNNPAIADLLNQRKTIDEQIKVIEILTKDNKVGTN